MEIVYRESDKILGGVSGFAMSTTNGILHLMQELTNQILKEQKLFLYPNEPYKFAEELKEKFFLN